MNSSQIIRDYILKNLLQQDVPLTDNTPLIEGGYLTSLQTVNLALFLVESFGVEIAPEEVNEQHFYSLLTLTNLVNGKLREQTRTEERTA